MPFRVYGEAATITSGLTFPDSQDNLMLRRSVERVVHLIGELLSRAVQHEPGLEDEIPSLRNIFGLRNRIAHGYEEIRDEVVWDAATNRIPLLRERLIHLLDHPVDGHDG